MATNTLADLKATADTANANLADAQHRLEAARTELLQASGAHHAAIVAMTNGAPQPAAPAPTKATGRAATVQAPASPLETAEQRLEKALADYEQVRRDLGLSPT